MHPDRQPGRSIRALATRTRWLALASLAVAALPVDAQNRTFGERHRMRPHVRGHWEHPNPFYSSRHSSVLADLDGDGDLDLVVVDRVYLNDGTNRFLFDQELQATTPPTALAAGDIDGDGDVDLIAGSSEQGWDGVLINDRGTFVYERPRLFSDLSLTNTNAIELADLDGDGDLDLSITKDFFPNKAYLNDGLGFFTEIPVLRFPDSEDMRIGDIDGDGDNDLVLAVFAVKLLANDGSAGWTDVTAGSIFGAAFPTTIELGDVDADGDLDIWVGNKEDQDDELLINDGSGVFTSQALPPTKGWTRAGCLCDLDGDGDLDVVISTADSLYAMENRGAAGFVDASVAFLGLRDGGHWSVEAVDLEGDGDLDLVLGGSLLLLGDGGGRYLPPEEPLPREGVGTPHGLVSGDVDGDGDLDLVTPELLLGDGAGSFTASPDSIDDREGAEHWALGDLDGDGDLDLVVAYAPLDGAAQVDDLVLLNDGGGKFTVHQGLPHPHAATVVALGDVDGDGDLDLVAGRERGVAALYLNNGSARFFSAPGFAGTDFVRGAELADLDGDGDLDCAFATYDVKNRLFLGDGAGNFADASSRLPFDSARSLTVEAADMDGDGDLDLLFGNATVVLGTTSPLMLYVNSGPATFTNEPQRIATTLPQFPVPAIGLGDINADGDLDVLLPGPYQLLNNGSGYLSNRPFLLEDDAEPASRSLALVDVDGDGDMDIVALGASRDSALLVNLTRQLGWKSAPRVGRDLELVINGPWGGGYVLFGSTRTALRTTPFGTQRISRSDIFLTEAGSLDGSGTALFTRKIAANPALIGVDLYWQALVGPPRRWTNLERTTIQGY